MDNMAVPIELEGFPLTSLSSSKKENNGRKSTFKVKRRLIERKKLHLRCCRVNDIMCIIALFGIVLMITDTELRFNQMYTTSTTIIRPLISVSTVLLIGLVLYYHALEIRLYAINNHIADWRVILTIRSIFITICEVFVCAIHPFPYVHKSSTISSASNGFIWLEMLLTLPMFARLYLIARSVTLHSPLVSAASSRTIGYLNRVPITISFILRAFLQTYPAGCWSCVMIVMLLIASWSMHACEKGMWLPINSLPSTTSTSTFTDAMWLMIVTFTTVGYGDITPQTYCGRGVSVITAFFGVFASAVLIAVFTSKISLSPSEQMVLDFFDRINRARAYKEKTMKIIQYSVLAWFLKRRGHRYRARFNSLYRLHTVIREARMIKQEQRNATNGNESMMTVLSNIYYEQKSHDKTLVKLKQHIGQLQDKMNGSEKKLESKLDSIADILTHTSPASQHSWL